MHGRACKQYTLRSYNVCFQRYALWWRSFPCRCEKLNKKAEGFQISHFYGSFSNDTMVLKGRHVSCEPAWPSGKALFRPVSTEKDLCSVPLRLSPLFKLSCGPWTLSLWHCPLTVNETLKWLSALSSLMELSHCDGDSLALGIWSPSSPISVPAAGTSSRTTGLV